MKQPDFDNAWAYARKRLSNELHPDLYYHSLFHTRDDVVPAAQRLAAHSGVNGEDMLLLSTAAWYHDLGFVEQPEEHEAIGCRIAAEVLPTFGYRPDQIRVIHNLIMATRMPQRPQTLLEQLLSDADLDVLGRVDFLERNEALRSELAAYGKPTTDTLWYDSQLTFMLSHTYFTPAAHALRDAQKQTNIAALRRLLEQSTPRIV